MAFAVLSSLRRIIRHFRQPHSLFLRHEKRKEGAWLTTHLPEGKWKPPHFVGENAILQRLTATNAKGKQPLWEGYGKLKSYTRTDDVRTAEEVSTFGPQGKFFAWLARERKPKLIVEIGTAFGCSGMYFLAGLEAEGRLLTFEPNALWAKQASENLRTVSDRFTLFQGTFEEGILQSLRADETIDLALIDAIHTSEAVLQQFSLVISHVRSGALIIIDDIDFSDDMKKCWAELVGDERVCAAVHCGRFGVLEM